MFEPAAVRTERAVGGAAARPAGRLGRGRPRRGSGGGAVPPHRPGPARGREGPADNSWSQHSVRIQLTTTNCEQFFLFLLKTLSTTFLVPLRQLFKHVIHLSYSTLGGFFFSQLPFVVFPI